MTDTTTIARLLNILVENCSECPVEHMCNSACVRTWEKLLNSKVLPTEDYSILECVDKVKYSNDEWILVEDDLPHTEEQVNVVLTHKSISDYEEYGTARYLTFDNGEKHWLSDKYGYLNWDKIPEGQGGSSLYKVIAWSYIKPFHH